MAGAGDSPSITQIAQAGTEVTPGIYSAPTKRLPNTKIMLKSDGDFSEERTSGSIFIESVIPGVELATGTSEGPINFADILWPLVSCVGYAAPTGDATNGFLWDITPNPLGGDAYKTFSMERGDSKTAYRYLHTVWSGLTLTFDKRQASHKGDLLARAVKIDTLTTSGVTSLDKTVLIPKKVAVYYADTMAGLAAGTKITRMFQVEFKISNRYVPIYQMDETEDSFATIVQAEPDVTLMLKLGAQAEAPATRVASTAYTLGQIVKPTTANGFHYEVTTAGTTAAGVDPAWSTTLGGTTTDGTVVFTTIIKDFAGPLGLQEQRDGEINYFRIKGEGPLVGAGTSNKLLFQLDVAAVVNKTVEVNDEGGVQGASWNMRVVNDTTAGYPFRFQIRSRQGTIS